MHVTPNEAEYAKQYDLLTFMLVYNPSDLRKCGRKEYCLNSHDSLKISNGKWHWCSRGIGGKTAINYLMTVEGYNFPDAVRLVNKYCGNGFVSDDCTIETVSNNKKNTFVVPPTDDNIDAVKRYLNLRGISDNVIEHCVAQGVLKQDSEHKNAMFCGYDLQGEIKYISLCGTLPSKRFKGIVAGSDKEFSFRINPRNKENVETLHIFEAAIDAMSYATILELKGKAFGDVLMLSLEGVCSTYRELPKSLMHVLETFPTIRKIIIHFDSDDVGQAAAISLGTMLASKYNVTNIILTKGKDVNDVLKYIKTNRN